MVHEGPENIIVTIRPGLLVSQTCFQVGTRHFELNKLAGLEPRQSGRDPLTRQSALLAGIGLVMVVAFARYMHPAGLIITTTVLIGLALLALISAQRRPRRLELWAHYKGQDTQLFVSDDWWLFSAVERQLRRSLTETRLGHVAPPPPTVATPSVPHPSMLHPSKMHPAGQIVG